MEPRLSPAQPARKREKEGRKGAKSEAAGLKSGERRGGEAKNRRRKAGGGTCHQGHGGKGGGGGRFSSFFRFRESLISLLFPPTMI